MATKDNLIEDFVKNLSLGESFPFRVTPDGRVFRFYKTKKEWRRADRDTSRGYKWVTYKGYYLMAHRVVYRHLVGPLDSQKVINHKNGKKTDNSPENLELVTIKENNDHALYSGLCKYTPVGKRKSIFKATHGPEIIRRNKDGCSKSCLAKRFKKSHQYIDFVLSTYPKEFLE